MRCELRSYPEPFVRAGAIRRTSGRKNCLCAGHSVRVFSATCSNGGPPTTSISAQAYELCALPARWWPHGVLLSSGLRTMVAEYAPQLILWFQVEQFFGRDLISYNEPPIVSFFGLNRGMHEFDWRKRGIRLCQRLHAITWRILRGVSRVKLAAGVVASS